MPIAEVAEQLRGYRCDLVEVTGGEPLLQEGVSSADARAARGGHDGDDRNVGRHRRRAGSIRASIKIMDLKCPGSGECERNLWSNLDHLTLRDEIKFVIADRADYEWARDAIVSATLRARVNAFC